MPIPLERARAAIAEFDVPGMTQLFAQAHAKHVLNEVGESPENFPAFDADLDDKVTYAAYGLLAAGCSVIEQEDRAGGATALERAASLLQYVHGPISGGSRESAFHVLVASMAFYAAGHYSRAFVAIRGVEERTVAAQIVAAFLRKDVARLISGLNQVLLAEPAQFEDQDQLNEWAITVLIARAVAVTLEFTLAGPAGTVPLAEDYLRDGATIASVGRHPSWWWVIRLLRLMIGDLGSASPWQMLPPFFGPSGADGLSKYIRLLAFSSRPVTELWVSQRAALPLVLNQANRGAVVNLRTSSGKTRVAELAILQTLLEEPTARILYLAPFRSLALEVEQTLQATFGWLGYGVSHLYGGSRVSSVDTELAEQSTITIATPEKARALFRAAPTLYENIRLVIVDEGHLIGPSERFVRNEVFLDHVRIVARTTGARVLLLSAVLPNAQDLAEWITGDQEAVARSAWKPSAERFGLLRWNGSRVRIEWQGDVASFNPAFVEARPLRFGRRRKAFPSNKNEAVAATAVRLCSIGPVMIFTGRAVSVPNLAGAVLIALGEEPGAYPWPEHEWKVFEAVCKEELDSGAIELRAARAGVICHSNRLTPQVRLALEHLMRSRPPKIVVATTTLAQGVNIGISSVIVATPYIGKRTLDKRDFWNICGRAGRAFVDGEGKILYAIDDTGDRWQIAKDEDLARSYFGAAGGDRVESGLLFVVRILHHVATQAGVAFDHLLELAAENDFSALGEKREVCEQICDLVDDGLLALHSDAMTNPQGVEPDIWVEEKLRGSLAAIQARQMEPGLGPNEVVAFLRARARSAVRRVAESERSAVVASGLPLSVALRANQSLGLFSTIADSYLVAGQSPDALSEAVRALEEWTRSVEGGMGVRVPAGAKLDVIRGGWLQGVALQELSVLEKDAREISKDFYGYYLPWITHAASQQLRIAGEIDRADAFGRIALLVELGVPSETAAWIFLAGVRSRVSATELAAIDIDFGNSVAEIGRALRDPDLRTRLGPVVSSAAAEWLALLAGDMSRSLGGPIPRFPVFRLEDRSNADVLHVRRLNGRVYLSSVDGHTRIPVAADERLPFDAVANDARIVFRRLGGSAWRMDVRDPRVRL